MLPRDELALHQGYMYVAQRGTLVEELMALRALYYTSAVLAFICCSFVLIRTHLSTEYSHGCELSVPGIGGSELL